MFSLHLPFPGLPRSFFPPAPFATTGSPWSAATPSASYLPGLAALSSWPSPRFDITAYSQFLDLQHKVWQMWIDSAQTIALRLMLAPPWMAYSPWVREEWVRMVSEKVAASTEAMNVAVKAGIAGNGLHPHTLPKTAHGVLAPFSSRTSSNASRLGTRVLRGAPLAAAAALAMPPLGRVLPKAGIGSKAGTGGKRGAKAARSVAAPRRGKRHG